MIWHVLYLYYFMLNKSCLSLSLSESGSVWVWVYLLIDLLREEAKLVRHKVQLNQEQWLRRSQKSTYTELQKKTMTAWGSMRGGIYLMYLIKYCGLDYVFVGISGAMSCNDW